MFVLTLFYVFLYRCGEIPINIIFRQFLLKVKLRKLISEPDLYKSVILARNDFFHHRNNKYNCWLFNPSWKVQPCLAILDKNSRYYFFNMQQPKNGSKSYVIHPQRNPMAHILPAPTSDQLCHAGIQSRAIKSIKLFAWYLISLGLRPAYDIWL